MNWSAGWITQAVCALQCAAVVAVLEDLDVDRVISFHGIIQNLYSQVSTELSCYPLEPCGPRTCDSRGGAAGEFEPRLIRRNQWTVPPSEKGVLSDIGPDYSEMDGFLPVQVQQAKYDPIGPLISIFRGSHW